MNPFPKSGGAWFASCLRSKAYIGTTKLTEMKHLMTLMALVVAVTAGAQGTSIHEYPWNPDFNNDTYIGSEDLMGLLSTYGTQFGLPPEPCDYDGTPLEDLVIGIADGSIVLDSMFIEYELEDVSTYYILGCPDPVTDTLIFANATMLQTFNSGSYYWHLSGNDIYSHPFYFQWEFNLQAGTYGFYLQNNTLFDEGFENDGFFGSYYSSTDYSPIPFPEGWYLDEEGIHIESGWSSNDWPYYANYLHILPYWHYAE